MKDYDKYFAVTSTPKRGMKITPNEESMREAARNYGYFVLLSNEVNDPFEALSLYRSKDIVEKGFGNLKDRLNFRRMQVSSELSLNGKLFVEFVAVFCKSEFPVFARIPNNFPPGKFVNEFSLANS
jgi:transposase